MSHFYFKVLDENNVDAFYSGENLIFSGHESWSFEICLNELKSRDRYYIGCFLGNKTCENKDAGAPERDYKDSQFIEQIEYENVVDIKKDEECGPVGVSNVEFEEDTLVAWAGITLYKDSDLMTIAVLPKYRGYGLANKMLELVLAKAKQKNLRSIFLEVRENNVGAIRLYEKNGFEKIAVRKNYYKAPVENAIVMQCVMNKR